MPVDRSSGTQHADYLGPSNRAWAIFLVSVLGLFLEMLLIRWIGTEIRIFAYLQNIVLIVCFLGLGIGCFTSRQPIVLRQSLIPLAILLLALAVPVFREGLGRTSEQLSVVSDFHIWDQASADTPLEAVRSLGIGLVTSFLILVLILDVFVPIGRLLGRLMDDYPNTIWAYSVNVAGSLIGTWLFALVSLVYFPPFGWFVILAVLLLFFLRLTGPQKVVNLVLLAIIVVLSWPAGWSPEASEVIWSPYQKLVLKEARPEDGAVGEWVVTVNNSSYQAMIDLSETHVAANPREFPPGQKGLSQYDIPLLLHPNPRSMLIVGSGTGNDVAGGLRGGATEIEAVEIDPAIISLGQRIHPERPYSSPAVQVVNDDARSVFATSSKKYDLIVFGLLDSHTTTAMTNARLDHYVYTRESITRARELLADGGIMVLSFEAQKPFIADRMAAVLREVFDQDPIAFRVGFSSYGWGGLLFVTGDLDSARNQIAQNERLDAFIKSSQDAAPLSLTYTTKIATDDWPYIYLETPRIPNLYYLLTGVMLLVLFQSYKRWGASGLVSRWSPSHWHFFFLGAAFLLLEVQNISKASVVLGNTWLVNAVIVSGVLIMVLLSNLLVRRFPQFPYKAAYAALIGICLGLYFVDLAQFAFLPYFVKAVLVGGLTTLPVLFSGIIFIRSFEAYERKDEALGANLTGAVAGALLQSATFVIGIKALLLVVAGLYFLSFLTRPQKAEDTALQPRGVDG